MLVVRFFDIEWVEPAEFEYFYQGTTEEYDEYNRAYEDFKKLPKDVVFELEDDYHCEYDVEDAPDHLSEIFGFYVRAVDVEWIS